jgi:hypothetical protein
VVLFDFYVAVSQIHTSQDLHLFYELDSNFLWRDHWVFFYFEEMLQCH